MYYCCCTQFSCAMRDYYRHFRSTLSWFDLKTKWLDPLDKDRINSSDGQNKTRNPNFPWIPWRAPWRELHTVFQDGILYSFQRKLLRNQKKFFRLIHFWVHSTFTLKSGWPSWFPAHGNGTKIKYWCDLWPLKMFLDPMPPYYIANFLTWNFPHCFTNSYFIESVYAQRSFWSASCDSQFKLSHQNWETTWHSFFKKQRKWSLTSA